MRDEQEDTYTMTVPPWDTPKRVDANLYFMYLNEWESPGIIKRYAIISWAADGTGAYSPSMHYEDRGYGFYCWPEFRALSDAQDFIERLWCMPFATVKALNGSQWPNVVL